MNQPAIDVRSEIGPLRRVLLHRPGRELENLMPEYIERLLFDDIPYLKIAREEHDAFCDLLRQNGAEVVYLDADVELDIDGVRRLAAALRPGGLLVAGFGLDDAHVPFTMPPGFAFPDLAAWDAATAAAGLGLRERSADWAATSPTPAAATS